MCISPLLFPASCLFFLSWLSLEYPACLVSRLNWNEIVLLQIIITIMDGFQKYLLCIYYMPRPQIQKSRLLRGLPHFLQTWSIKRASIRHKRHPCVLQVDHWSPKSGPPLAYITLSYYPSPESGAFLFFLSSFPRIFASDLYLLRPESS